ncbi:MAG TPA: cupin domain-containing protein [Polyangia bacterium]|nr:cupin domain-containing protein [Polyangia bacterium]
MKREDLRLDEIRTRAESADFPWEPFRPGVEIHRLWGEPGVGEAGVLLRYAPGGVVPAHRHEEVEEIYVLRGSQRDERGVYQAGTHVVNPRGSSHTVQSPEGCLVLVIWRRPNTWLGPAGE